MLNVYSDMVGMDLLTVVLRQALDSIDSFRDPAETEGHREVLYLLQRLGPIHVAFVESALSHAALAAQPFWGHLEAVNQPFEKGYEVLCFSSHLDTRS